MATLDEINDLLLEFLREHKREQLAGHTVARLHDDVRGLRGDVAEVLGRIESVERRVTHLETGRTPSGRPGPRRRLDSIAVIEDDDPTAVRAFKSGPLADALKATQFVSTAWKIMVALSIVGAAFATIYTALHH